MRVAGHCQPPLPACHLHLPPRYHLWWPCCWPEGRPSTSPSTWLTTWVEGETSLMCLVHSCTVVCSAQSVCSALLYLLNQLCLLNQSAQLCLLNQSVQLCLLNQSALHSSGAVASLLYTRRFSSTRLLYNSPRRRLLSSILLQILSNSPSFTFSLPFQSVECFLFTRATLFLH